MSFEYLIPNILHQVSIDRRSQVVCVPRQLQLVWLLTLVVQVAVLLSTGYHGYPESTWLLAHLVLG